ncbi:MAG: hypothetical protein ABL876_15595, partial [Chitinophagaceae bacterium]
MKRTIIFATLICVTFAALFSSCSKNETPDEPPLPALLPDTLATGWSIQSIGSSESITDVFFSDNSTGFLTGSTGVFRSVNGGGGWQKVFSSNGLINIAMSSNTHALFARPGRIYVTRNGGTSFDSTSINDPALSDVYCVNNTVAYASGLTFWKTTDGGTTWVNPVSYT